MSKPNQHIIKKQLDCLISQF